MLRSNLGNEYSQQYIQQNESKLWKLLERVRNRNVGGGGGVGGSGVVGGAVAGSGGSSHNRKKRGIQQQQQQPQVQQQQQENLVCADCHRIGIPTVYASVNLGVFLCRACGSHHKSLLGPNISIIKDCVYRKQNVNTSTNININDGRTTGTAGGNGTDLPTVPNSWWAPDEVKQMAMIGNTKAKDVLYGTNHGRKQGVSVVPPKPQRGGKSMSSYRQQQQMTTSMRRPNKQQKTEINHRSRYGSATTRTATSTSSITINDEKINEWREFLMDKYVNRKFTNLVHRKRKVVDEPVLSSSSCIVDAKDVATTTRTKGATTGTTTTTATTMTKNKKRKMKNTLLLVQSPSSPKTLEEVVLSLSSSSSPPMDRMKLFIPDLPDHIEMKKQ